jgi:hypothetical protein
MMSALQHLAAALFATTLVAAPAQAADSAAHSTSPATHGASASHHFHANELALFLGGTREGTVDESFFTIGGEYERRSNAYFGLSMVAEYISEADAWTVVFPLTLRPLKGYGLKLFVGPGFQNKPPHHHAAAHEEPHHAASETAPPHENGEEGEGRETFFLLRVAAGYAFEFGERYSLTPLLALDLTRENGEWEDGLVFGVGFGIAF